MATHSSIPAWRIPWTGEPGGLQSMGSHRVGHDFTLIPGLFTPLPGWFYTVLQCREQALPSAGDFPGLLQALPGWS